MSSREGNSNAVVIRNGDTIPFVDRFGEDRTLHRGFNGKLSVKRDRQTISTHLNQIVGEIMGNKVREKRKALGMTLEELCIRSGLSGTTPKSRIWEIENRPKTGGMKFGTVYAIAAGLGCEPTELMPTMEEVKALANIKTEALSRLRL